MRELDDFMARLERLQVCRVVSPLAAPTARTLALSSCQTRSRTPKSLLLPIACADFAVLSTPRRQRRLIPTALGAICRLRQLTSFHSQHGERAPASGHSKALEGKAGCATGWTSGSARDRLRPRSADSPHLRRYRVDRQDCTGMHWATEHLPVNSRLAAHLLQQMVDERAPEHVEKTASTYSIGA